LERIRFRTHFPEPQPKVNADPSEIERVVFNLMTNAVEAMPEGGDLTVGVQSVRGETRISVEDTGTGIPDEDRPNIFRPFYTTRERGVGMGLAICRRIVEENGGSVAVETAPGKGSRFTIKFPGG
jgi:two-component system sensor histidine kinase HydH